MVFKHGSVVVLKLQRPLFSSDGRAGILAYNQDRSFRAEIPFSEAQLPAIFGNEPKAYWLCRLPAGRRGKIHLINQVREQNW